MDDTSIRWPTKTRQDQWAVWDSARLDNFQFRDNDIVIASYSKAGTTWTQHLVAQLIFQGDPGVFGPQRSIWPEFRGLSVDDWYALAAGMDHRRIIKTHSPIDSIPFRRDLKYLYVARDPRDVVWSMHHHASNLTVAANNLVNDMPGRIGPEARLLDCDVVTFYHQFLDTGSVLDGSGPANFWDHIKGWWSFRHLSNVHLVHYANLKADFETEAHGIAAFLEMEIAEAVWPRIAANCSLEHMRGLSAKVDIFKYDVRGRRRDLHQQGREWSLAGCTFAGRNRQMRRNCGKGIER